MPDAPDPTDSRRRRPRRSGAASRGGAAVRTGAQARGARGALRRVHRAALERSYRRKLAPFLEEPTFVPTWNWAAALLSPFWFLYRKLYLWFAVFYIVPGLVLRWLVPTDTALTLETANLPENRQLVIMTLAVMFSTAIAAGGTANWLLFRRGRTAIRVLTMQDMPPGEAFGLLRRIGGTNLTFTLLFLAMTAALGLGAFAGGG